MLRLAEEVLLSKRPITGHHNVGSIAEASVRWVKSSCHQKRSKLEMHFTGSCKTLFPI